MRRGSPAGSFLQAMGDGANGQRKQRIVPASPALKLMGKLTYRALPNWIGLVRGVLVIAGPAAEPVSTLCPHSFVPPVRPNARAAGAIFGADLTLTGAGC